MTRGPSDSEDGRPQAARMMAEHAAVVARVCMALLGDAASVERALERVAREASALTFEEGRSALPRLLGLARVACATHLSKLPLRTGPFRPEDGGLAQRGPDTARDHRPGVSPLLAREALGKLKPTEREAVVLHLVGGLDVAGVAEACGIDEAAARSRLARGVSQLVQEKKR